MVLGGVLSSDKPWHKWAFVISGLAILGLSITQTVRTIKAEQEASRLAENNSELLGKIEKNTEPHQELRILQATLVLDQVGKPYDFDVAVQNDGKDSIEISGGCGVVSLNIPIEPLGIILSNTDKERALEDAMFTEKIKTIDEGSNLTTFTQLPVSVGHIECISGFPVTAKELHLLHTFKTRIYIIGKLWYPREKKHIDQEFCYYMAGAGDLIHLCLSHNRSYDHEGNH